MKLPLKTALIAAVVYIIVEIIFVSTEYNHDYNARVITFGLNSMCLLFAIATSILINFNKKKHEGLSMLSDVKMGIATSAFYALVVATFIFSYHKWIDPEYKEILMDQHLEALQKQSAVEHLNMNMENDPTMYEGQTAEDIQEQSMDSVSFFMTAEKAFPMTLFSLMILGMFYSFAIMGLNRLVLAKLR